MGFCCLVFLSFSCDHGLPMSAAVTATTTVGAATAAYCAAAPYCSTAANSAAVESTADCYVRRAAVATAEFATVPAIPTVPTITTTPAVAATIPPSVVAAAVPRAGTDEQAT
jgi:hypothetical protein